MKYRLPALAPIACLLSLLLPSSASAAVLRVRPDSAGDGSTWASALGSVKAALSAAQAGDEVWVAAGTYKPAVAADALKVTVPVSLYGGFAGTETTRDQRNPAANVTVLDGNKLDTVLTVTGAAGTLVDGFTIQNGKGHGVDSAPPTGGGIHVTAPGTVISGNRIASNLAGVSSVVGPAFPMNGTSEAYGGGIYAAASDLVIRGNVFSDNAANVASAVAAYAFGGGVYVSGARMLVERNSFVGNRASAVG